MVGGTIPGGLSNVPNRRMPRFIGRMRPGCAMAATTVEATLPAARLRRSVLPAKPQRINLISTVTNQGKVRFMVYRETMKAKTLIRFMRRLIKDVERKVFVIFDNLRVHHSKLVHEWLEEHREQIEVFYLPSYSPELNPDEYLNCDLKVGVHSGVPATSKSELARKAIGHLRMLQKRPGSCSEILQTSQDRLCGLVNIFNCRFNKENQPESCALIYGPFVNVRIAIRQLNDFIRRSE